MDGHLPDNSTSKIKAPSRPVKVSRYDSEGPSISWASKEEGEKAKKTVNTIENAFSDIIRALGDPDPKRDALVKTPHRAAKALLFFTKGYEEDLHGESVDRICLQWFVRYQVVKYVASPLAG